MIYNLCREKLASENLNVTPYKTKTNFKIVNTKVTAEELRVIRNNSVFIHRLNIHIYRMNDHKLVQKLRNMLRNGRS